MSHGAQTAVLDGDVAQPALPNIIAFTHQFGAQQSGTSLCDGWAKINASTVCGMGEPLTPCMRPKPLIGMRINRSPMAFQ